MKHLKLYEQFVNEAYRVGRSSWSSVVSELASMGWTVEDDIAHKYYTNDDDEERKLELSNSGSDEIEWTLYDGEENEINSGSFDAEGLSAGEIDGEVWNYVEE